MLQSKILDKQAVIGIIGLGYVGLPLGLAFLRNDYHVLGFDIDSHKVALLNRGKCYIKHITDQDIAPFRQRGSLEATADFARLPEADAVIICVPTPLNKHREPDLKYVLDTTRAIAATLRRQQLVILESTTYPETTEKEMLPILAATGMKVGEDFYLGYSPEREDPGNPAFATAGIPKVVSGVTSRCLELTKLLYDQVIVKTVPVSSPGIAESAKLLENIYRAVNIALVNELKMLFDKMGLDVWEVIEAAKTKPFGFQAFYPGPGLGGHCIPIDPFYLTWKAREYGVYTKFIELAGEVNSQMPHYVVHQTLEAMNLRGKALQGARVLVLGLAYKKDVDDTRESPAFKVIELLEERGALVDYNDPYIPKAPLTRKYKLDKESVELTPENLSAYDCVMIITDHSVYDAAFIEAHSRLIIDTRNVVKQASPKVVKA